jgi:hypothetical protein
VIVEFALRAAAGADRNREYLYGVRCSGVDFLRYGPFISILRWVPRYEANRLLSVSLRKFRILM